MCLIHHKDRWGVEDTLKESDESSFVFLLPFTVLVWVCVHVFVCVTGSLVWGGWGGVREAFGLLLSWLVINRKGHREWILLFSESRGKNEKKFISAVLHYRHTFLLPEYCLSSYLKKSRKLHDLTHRAFPLRCSRMLSCRISVGCVPTEASIVGTSPICLAEL